MKPFSSAENVLQSFLNETAPFHQKEGRITKFTPTKVSAKNVQFHELQVSKFTLRNLWVKKVLNPNKLNGSMKQN